MRPKEILTREFLVEHYIEKRLSDRQIANLTGIKSHTSVTKAIKKFNLIRSKKNYLDIITREFILEQYIKQKRSIRSLAKEVSCDETTIREYIFKFEIPFRLESKANSKAKGIWYKELSSAYWNGIQQCARDRNLIFDITMEYVWSLFEQQKGLCCLSGVKIEFFKLYRYKNTQTASLDRIDSSKGYIEGNVQWIHKDIQSMKMNKQDKDLIYWANQIAKTHPL